MYRERGMRQPEVAADLHVFQSGVSRLLNWAAGAGRRADHRRLDPNNSRSGRAGPVEANERTPEPGHDPPRYACPRRGSEVPFALRARLFAEPVTSLCSAAIDVVAEFATLLDR